MIKTKGKKRIHLTINLQIQKTYFKVIFINYGNGKNKTRMIKRNKIGRNKTKKQTINKNESIKIW